jgi:hypothetical protein
LSLEVVVVLTNNLLKPQLQVAVVVFVHLGMVKLLAVEHLLKVKYN